MEKNSKKRGEQTVLKDIENELLNDFESLDKSLNDSEKDFIGRRVSYYVEENERLLNLLTTNCEPILSEMTA
jgi:hypothetical protein